MGLFDYFKEKRAERLRLQHQQTLMSISTQLQRNDISCIEILMISTEFVRYLLDMDLLTEPSNLQKLRKYRAYTQDANELYAWLNTASVCTLHRRFDDDNYEAAGRRVQIFHPQDWFADTTISNFLLRFTDVTAAIIADHQELSEVDQRRFQTKYHRLGNDVQVIIGDFILSYLAESVK